MGRLRFLVGSALVLALGAVTLGTGCGGSTTSGGAGSGGSGGSAGSGGSGGSAGNGTCVVDSDCPDNGLCGYPTQGQCSATGRCFVDPGGRCFGLEPGCACDGTMANLICNGLPSGYASKPVAHPGECGLADAGADACNPGVCLSTVPCADDSACAALGSKCDPCAKLCGCGGAATFKCGDALVCDAGTQYCRVAEGGPCCNPPSYSCESIPTACASDPTCPCLEAMLGAAQCDEAGGGVTLTFAYP